MEQQPRMVPLGGCLPGQPEGGGTPLPPASSGSARPAADVRREPARRRAPAADMPEGSGVPDHLVISDDPKQLARYVRDRIESQRSPEAPPYSMVLFENPLDPRYDELMTAFARLPERAEWFASMALTFQAEVNRLTRDLDRRKAEVKQIYLSEWRRRMEAERQQEEQRLLQQFHEQLHDPSERVRLAAMSAIQKQLEQLSRQYRYPTESDIRDAVALDPEAQRLQAELLDAQEMRDWMAHYAKYQNQLSISAHGAKELMKRESGGSTGYPGTRR